MAHESARLLVLLVELIACFLGLIEEFSAILSSTHSLKISPVYFC